MLRILVNDSLLMPLILKDPLAPLKTGHRIFAVAEKLSLSLNRFRLLFWDSAPGLRKQESRENIVKIRAGVPYDFNGNAITIHMDVEYIDAKSWRPHRELKVYSNRDVTELGSIYIDTSDLD